MRGVKKKKNKVKRKKKDKKKMNEKKKKEISIRSRREESLHEARSRIKRYDKRKKRRTREAARFTVRK